MKAGLRGCILAAMLGFAAPTFAGESFSLPRLGAALLSGLASRNCLRYCITGSCTRLDCSSGICQVHTSARIRHRLPDLIVSSWNQGGHPWKELTAPMRALATQAGLSSGAPASIGRNSQRRAEFREADVIANPLTTLPLPGLCRTGATPWQPYYSSLADAALWRSGQTELLEPASWIPAAWPVVSGNTRIGNLFPRKGFGHYGSSAQAAMVSALRALDIAEQGGLHLRLPIVSTASPTELKRLSPGRLARLQGACWQQLHPLPSPGCHTAFTPLPASASAYAWQVWTEYECCLPGPGQVIAVLPAQPICP